MTRGEASTSRRAPSRSWLLSRLGVLFCIAAAFAAVTALAKGRREALWQVVQLCVANHNWTGASFPCLTVNTSDGEERGYIVLRRPVGRPDTILAPTRKITGLEDPLLRSSETPNYFLDAWNERTLVSDRIQRPLAHEQVALAVNSRYTRTQDQFHIHIGCVDREASEILDTISPDLSANRWVRARKRFYGFDIWGLQIAKETLDGVNPVRLLEDGFPDESGSRGLSTIVLAGVKLPDGRDGFALLTWRSNLQASRLQFTAEDFLDERCGR